MIAKHDGIWGFSAVSREFWLTRLWQTGWTNLINCNQKPITKLCCDSLRQRRTNPLYGELPPRAGWMWGAEATNSTVSIKKCWLQQGGIFPVMQNHQCWAPSSCTAKLLLAAHCEGKPNYHRDKPMPRVTCKAETCLLGLPSKLWRRAHLPSQLSLPLTVSWDLQGLPTPACSELKCELFNAANGVKQVKFGTRNLYYSSEVVGMPVPLLVVALAAQPSPCCLAFLQCHRAGSFWGADSSQRPCLYQTMPFYPELWWWQKWEQSFCTGAGWEL